VFTARFAGLPVTLFALRAAVAACFPAGLARPEAVIFLALLAFAFAEILLTGWKNTFAMLDNQSERNVRVCPRRSQGKARAAPFSSATRIPNGSTSWTLLPHGEL
jgi:hypothetical protein